MTNRNEPQPQPTKPYEFLLNYGKITEDGPHADLVAANGEYANLWNRQTGAYLK